MIKDNILVTAIGSMSAPAILKEISKISTGEIIGTDIYPKEWQYNSRLVSKFFQVSKAKSKDYISQINNICIDNNIRYVIPLTDPEVDCLSENRYLFKKNGIILCISCQDAIFKSRNKKIVENIFKEIDGINTIPSFCGEQLQNNSLYPLVAKPINGRSSEGLYILQDRRSLAIIPNQSEYIFQHYIPGEIYTIDVIRDLSGNSFSISRKELIRTNNGAGISVEIIENEFLKYSVEKITNILNILGCINIEFLYYKNKFYLMDINPRFSAGIGFSLKAGYNFVSNHLTCFQNKNIEKHPSIKEGILHRISLII